MFRLFTEQKDLLQKIFNEADITDQISLLQVNKITNEIAKSDQSTFGKKEKLQLIPQLYEKLPNHEHPDAIKLRNIFAKATRVQFEKAELSEQTIGQIAGQMNGILLGMKMALEEQLDSHLQQNLRRK